ncbi:uncharacterized [Tachysurus ichikawai]
MQHVAQICQLSVVYEGSVSTPSTVNTSGDVLRAQNIANTCRDKLQSSGKSDEELERGELEENRALKYER